MKSIFPNYAEGIVNLVSSIQKYFGVQTNKKSLSYVDEELKEGKYKNVVLVLYDGFGYNILKKNNLVAPFLNENIKGKISTVFPPTTTAATTSVMSGLEPYEHGWLGWDMYFKDFDKVMTLYLNVEKGTDKTPLDWPGTKKLLNFEYITNKVSKQEGCKGEIVSPYDGTKYKTIKEMNDKIVSACNNSLRNYVYAYYNEPDSLMHEYGTESELVKAEMKKIDEAFKELCDRLDDTLIIMIADHGHIDIETITLTDYEEIYSMLKGTTSIDQRACSLMVKDEYKSVFKDAFEKLFKDDFILLTKEEVIGKGVFGNGVKNKYFDDAMGDFLAVGISNKAIRYDNTTEILLSTHAGITEDEVYVPLVIVKKRGSDKNECNRS